MENILLRPCRKTPFTGGEYAIRAALQWRGTLPRSRALHGLATHPFLPALGLTRPYAGPLMASLVRWSGLLYALLTIANKLQHVFSPYQTKRLFLPAFGMGQCYCQNLMKQRKPLPFEGLRKQKLPRLWFRQRDHTYWSVTQKGMFYGCHYISEASFSAQELFYRAHPL